MPKIKLVLADDHAVVRSGLRMLLQAQPDMEIVGEAESGTQALAQVRRLQPDVILMDIQMPEMDGLEATRRIRERWASEHKPWIVAITANAMQGDRDMCLDAGMNDYITKPIRIEKMIESLETASSSLRGQTQAGVVESIDTPNLANAEAVGQLSDESNQRITGSVLDQKAISRLEQIAGDNTAFLVDFIDTFLGSVPKVRVELQQSIDNHDADSLRRQAHTLKSNSASLGASHLEGLCKALEYAGKNGELENAQSQLDQIVDELEQVIPSLETLRHGYST